MEFKRNAAALALCLVLALALVEMALADGSGPNCLEIAYDASKYKSIWEQTDQISLSNKRCRTCCKKAQFRFGYLSYDNVRICECTNNLIHKLGHVHGIQVGA